MYLEIYVSEQKIELLENTKIPVKLTNPMFNEIGSRTFSFEIDAISHQNQMIFGFEGKIGRLKTEPTELPFKAFFKKQFIFGGTVKATKVNTKITVYFKINETGFFSNIRSLLMPEITASKVKLDLTNSLNAVYNNKSNIVLAPTKNKGYNDVPTEFFNQLLIVNKQISAADKTAQIYCWQNPLPFYKVSHLFELIAKLNNLTVVNELFLEKPELKSLVLYVNHTRDNHLDLLNYIEDLLNMSVMDFMNEFAILFNATFFINEMKRELIIRNNDTIIESLPTNDFSSNLKIIDIERESYTGFTYKLEKDNSDSLLNDIEKDLGISLSYVDGDGEVPKNTSFSPCSSVLETISLYNNFTFPAGEAPYGADYFYIEPTMQIKIPYIDLSDEKSSSMNPRLFFYRGHVSAKNFNYGVIKSSDNFVFDITDFPNYLIDYLNSISKYPFITQDVKDINGNKLASANLNLYWEGQYGLIENFHKKTLFWYANRRVPVSGVGNLSIENLKTLSIFEKFSIKNHNYLFNTIDFNLELNKISAIQFTAFRV